jgi:hypothetical protein
VSLLIATSARYHFGIEMFRQGAHCIQDTIQSHRGYRCGDSVREQPQVNTFFEIGFLPLSLVLERIGQTLFDEASASLETVSLESEQSPSRNRHSMQLQVEEGGKDVRANLFRRNRNLIVDSSISPSKEMYPRVLRGM